MKTNLKYSSFNCGVLPARHHHTIQMAHGGAGSLSRELIDRLIVPAFDNEWLGQRHDSAVLPLADSRMAFTTDSYVVRPLFFPGGNIGTLAVYGTINDLAMAGATPRYISASLIIEEGFPIAQLERVIDAMQRAVQHTGVDLVTGDTKVVDRGHGDGLYINTAGLGVVDHTLEINPGSVQPGDAVILSGDIGRHGIAIMTAREELSFESPVESDCAPLHQPVAGLVDAGLQLHCLRDLTRGGLVTALKEIALDSGFAIHLIERSIPIEPNVQGACELLGLDPLYVANEGRMVVFLPTEQTAHALKLLKTYSHTKEAVLIGHVQAQRNQRVTMEGLIGVTRVLDFLSGEQLPRIC